MTYAARPLRLPDDRDALARLWADNLSDTRIVAAIPDRLRWLYDECPDGRVTTVLAVVQETGEVIGCGSILPRPTWVRGRRIAAGVLCDFAVSKAHRIAGAALTIQRALAEAGRAAGLELVYGYPNDKSLAVFKRVGYGVVGKTTTWVKPLRSAYKLRVQLGSRWAGGVAAVPVDLGLRARDAVLSLRGAPVTPGDGAAVERGVDGLWERARDAYVVVGEKSAAYLDWRYRRFPTAPHAVFGVSARGSDRLAAYAAYTVESGKSFVRELFADTTDGIVEALLLALGAELRSRGVDSISLSCLGDATFGARLRGAGFIQRPGERALVLRAEALADPVKAEVLDPARWFMLDGELDI
jgi:hypothetical protein